MQEFFQSDNAGNRTAPGCEAVDPVLASGQDITAGSKDTNATITVVAGESYAITCMRGTHVFGIATTAIAANCIWACGDGHTIIIKIPIGYTLLHYQTPSSTRRFILRRLN